MTDVQDNTDDETERLLAELEQQSQPQTDDAETKPAEAVESKPKPGKKKTAKVKKADSTPSNDAIADSTPSNIVTNTSRNPQRIKGSVIKVGERYTLTDVDLADERLMKKIDRAVSLSILTRGTN